MANAESRKQLSDLHMLVFGRIAHRARADAEDIGAWLGLPAAAVEILCDDLEAAGLLTRVGITGEP
jgi:DNA-binding MarR family transcriptional regulator